MLRIKSSIYLTGQANPNDQNLKIQATSRFEWFWSADFAIVRQRALADDG